MYLIDNAVIAAAGFGSRLGLDLPKCMVEVNRKFIIDYILEALIPNVKNIVIVVGYKAELIEEYCNKKYPSVVIVKNDDYSTTNTAYSMALGAKLFHGKCLFLDGDLVFHKDEIVKFLEKSKQVNCLLGVTSNITQNPVYVTLDKEKILKFSRKDVSEFEWANIFCSDSRILDQAKNFVYEELEKNAELFFHEINLYEIDTPEDMLNVLLSLGGK